MAKIFFHSLVFAPDGVSTAYLMTELAKQLQRCGHQITVLTTTPHYNLVAAAHERQKMKRRWLGLLYRSELDGITVWHVRVPRKGRRVYLRALDFAYFHFLSILVGILLIEKHDVVFTPSPPLTMPLVSWLVSKRMNAPLIYNIQEIYPDFAINQGFIRSPFLIRLLRWIEQVVYRKSTVIVPISEWFRRIVAERNVPKEKLCVIPNFVDTTIYGREPRVNVFSRSHGLLNDFIILYAGNVGLSQDWEAILVAAKAVADLPIQFILVGGGTMEKWVQQQIALRKLGNIRFLGYQEQELMPAVYASCDICIIPMKPGTTIDTLPSKIYTIMAAGKPMIVHADPNSELEWVISSIGCGFVVPPNDYDALVKVIRLAFENKEDLPTMGEKGRNAVRKQYSKEVVAQQYDALIQRLLVVSKTH